MSGKIFRLFIWYEDTPITGNDLNLSNIVAPRKELKDYQEGEKVKAKCSGFGLAPAIIGKIGSMYFDFYCKWYYTRFFPNLDHTFSLNSRFTW